MNEIMEFWQGLGAWQKLAYLAIPLLAWAVRVPASKLMLRLLTAFLASLGLKPGENLKESMLPALQVIFIAFGVLLALDYLRPPEPYFGLVWKLMVSSCVAATFSVAYSMCVFIPQLVQRTRLLSIRQQSTLLLRGSKFLVVFLGIASVMKVWGIDIGPALTGMGVVGAAFALAAQDSVKNFLGGLNNAAEQRFDVGDLIRVEGVVEGVVESVDVRSTKIRRLDTAPVHVPNSELADCAVINFGQRPNRRINWTVGLAYDTPRNVLRSIRERIENFIDECDYFEPDDSTGRNIRFSGLDESSVNLLVMCYTKSTEYKDYLVSTEVLALAILDIVEEEGGKIAFPTQSIYMNSPLEADTPGEPPC